MIMFFVCFLKCRKCMYVNFYFCSYVNDNFILLISECFNIKFIILFSIIDKYCL